MRSYKPIIVLSVLAGILAASPVCAQTQLVTTDFFPAAMEFQELTAIQQERSVTDPAQLAGFDRGRVLLELGLKRYASRTYALAGSGSLTIEILTLDDNRAAYSYLTALGGKTLKAGPPGDFVSAADDALLFTAGNMFVAVRGRATGDLSRRVAVSIANRIGRRDPGQPSLIKHFPADSCEPSSVRYFVGPQAMAAFGIPIAGAAPRIPADVEAAQARCSAQEQSGTLTILSFPTIQLAEEYFANGAVFEKTASGSPGVFTRQTGPLVGILEGNFSPQVADKTLGSIKFSYSVKWIYDKTRNQGRTLWGVPVRILGTVVRSLLFTALLCGLSVLAGVMIAAGRVYIRRRLGREDDSGYIRLKINEN